MPFAPPNARWKQQAAKRKADNRRADQRRGSAAARGYDARWDRARRRHLAEHPLCRYCELVDVDEPATLVDHLYPHNGDPELFWDETWWVSCCKPCHDGPKQATEARGLEALDALADRLELPRLAA